MGPTAETTSFTSSPSTTAFPTARSRSSRRRSRRPTRGWSDAQRRSIWYETDSGMTDDSDDDALCDIVLQRHRVRAPDRDARRGNPRRMEGRRRAQQGRGKATAPQEGPSRVEPANLCRGESFERSGFRVAAQGLGRVSRARITQIMDLLLLAPEIQARCSGVTRRSCTCATWSRSAGAPAGASSGGRMLSLPKSSQPMLAWSGLLWNSSADG